MKKQVKAIERLTNLNQVSNLIVPKDALQKIKGGSIIIEDLIDS